MAKKGNDFILRVRTATGPDVYTDVSANRTLALSIGGEEVNISTKESAGWRELLDGGGEKTVSISAEGVFRGASDQTLVRNLVMSGALESFQIDDGTEVLEGMFQVTSFDLSGDVNAEQAHSFSLESSGIPTVT